MMTMDTTMTMTTNTLEEGISQSSEIEVSHDWLKECVEEFFAMTEEPRAKSERCRDYYDGKQWTAEQIAALKRRKQSPVVNNRIKVKHNGLLGLTSVRKGDPKAYPRNQEQDSEAAEAVTDGLRYAADKVNLNSTFLECADNFFCEGYCGINVVVETMPNGDIEVVADHIPWDRIFFDPYSRKHDFSDARGKGYGLWMDESDILETFSDMDPDALSPPEVEHDEMMEDKPDWVQNTGKRKRHLVITHYFKYKKAWHIAIYTGGGFLLQPMQSPYLDEYGQPECPLELEHAYIDRENGRYGELDSFLDLQDEINHRRSKALFLLSQRQTFGSRGAIKNVKKMKRELAKPDGHVEVGQGEFGKDFGVLPTGDMTQGQLELLNEAKSEMDASSYSAQLAGERQQGDLSGVAIQRLQNSGVTELVKLFENFSNFKLRTYRKMWNRIKQFWNEEKWVRVTDDEDMLRWVGFNVPMTMKAFLEDTMSDDTLPRQMRLGASARLIELERLNPQALEQVIEVKNRAAELDMDLTLHESYDTVNVSQEQLDAILKFGAQGQFDIIDLLELSNITGKDKLIDRIEGRRKEAAEAAAEQGPDPQSQFLLGKAQEAQGKVAESQVKVAKTSAEAEQVQLENEVLKQNLTSPYDGNITI